MYINDVYDGDRVLVLDDVLSTGGTLEAITDALEDIGAEIADTVVVIKKVGGEDAFDGDRMVKTLINVDVRDGEVVIVDPTGDG
jgi:adenine phosphoribosyltransferase